MPLPMPDRKPFHGPRQCLPHLGVGPNNSWASMEEHCLSALGPAPVLSYFLSHESGPEQGPSAEEELRQLQAALANPEQRACIERGAYGETTAAKLGRCTPQITRNRLGGSWDEAVECRYTKLLAPEQALVSRGARDAVRDEGFVPGIQE